MNSILANTRRHDVSFYPSGRIDITARAAKAIGLADGDVIDIGYDNGEYMLFVARKYGTYTGSHEGVVHATKFRSNNFRCYSVTICRYMLQRFSDAATPLMVPFGKTVNNEIYGTMLFLITLNNLYRK